MLKAFDAEKLAEICITDDFSAYATKTELAPQNGRDRFYWFQDNGADILAVAHLDSVQRDGTCNVVETNAGLLATSGTLDDRLGAYIILEMFPRLGIKVDVLLTTDEEIGQSTGYDFDTDKQYRWMIQFDRAGTDVVMYQYETPELVRLVKAAGAPVGTGSYSDIADLEHLGCSGLNWGTGYADYHSARAHAWLDDTFKSLARFKQFYAANKNRTLEFQTHSYVDDLLVRSDSSWLVADCGDLVDMQDPSTYKIQPNVITCTKCARGEW